MHHPSTAVHAHWAWILCKDLRTVEDEVRTRISNVVRDINQVWVSCHLNPHTWRCVVTLKRLTCTADIPQIAQIIEWGFQEQRREIVPFFDRVWWAIMLVPPPWMARFIIDAHISSPELLVEDEWETLSFLDWTVACHTIDDIRSSFDEIISVLKRSKKLAWLRCLHVIQTDEGFLVTIWGVHENTENELSAIIGYEVNPITQTISEGINGIPAVPIPWRAQFLIPFLREVHPGHK